MRSGNPALVVSLSGASLTVSFGTCASAATSKKKIIEDKRRTLNI
jgi:hypothetical protein